MGSVPCTGISGDKSYATFRRKTDPRSREVRRQPHYAADFRFLADYPLMNLLQETAIGCPYCGETITLLVDGSVEMQQYIEDCEVCCRPIHIQVSVREDGEHQVTARSENE